jgi:glycosyltransferase involved in cell wall biosynthesis
MSSSPAVSVIMPCYNAERFISESIESILQQSFTDFELILINDGSTDGTLNIIKHYEFSDDRIVVIDKKNSGQTESMNVGIFKSRGQLIARLDNDDIAMPERLNEQVAYMRKSTEVVLLGTCAYGIDEYGATVKAEDYPTGRELYKNLIKMKRFFAHSSAMYRSNDVKQTHGYNPRIKVAQDYDLWLRLSERGKIDCLKKRLVKIRNHSANFSKVGKGVRRVFSSEAMAANVCHLLRAKGAIDPSASEKIDDWNIFLEWIGQQIEREGFLERAQSWNQIRNKFYSASSKLAGVPGLMKSIITSRDSLQKIYEIFYGTELPKALADEWINKNQES